MKMLFHPGQVVITATAMHELEQVAGHHMIFRGMVDGLLDRHISGDWGNLCDEDKQMNQDALATGDRILSKYNIRGLDLYVITDPVESGDFERQVTTILRPEDY